WFNDGNFTVEGSHTYATAGSYTIAVQIQRNDGVSTSASSIATVDSGSPIGWGDLYASGNDVSTAANTPFSGTVASFTDTGGFGGYGWLTYDCIGSAMPTGQAGDYTATIDWGDGTTSAGSVQSVPMLGSYGGYPPVAQPMSAMNIAVGGCVSLGSHFA